MLVKYIPHLELFFCVTLRVPGCGKVSASALSPGDAPIPPWRYGGSSPKGVWLCPYIPERLVAIIT